MSSYVTQSQNFKRKRKEEITISDTELDRIPGNVVWHTNVISTAGHHCPLSTQVGTWETFQAHSAY